MAAYQCLNCHEIDRGEDDCCANPDLFCINEMGNEIKRLRAFVKEHGTGGKMQDDDEVIASAQRILLRRISQQSLEASISNRSELNQFLAMRFGMRTVEEFACIFLNAKYKPIKLSTLFTGSPNNCFVQPRLVVKEALYIDAAAVILVHNHPGYIKTPSQEDIELTQSLKLTLNVVGVVLYDHLIVNGADVYSMRDRGQI